MAQISGGFVMDDLKIRAGVGAPQVATYLKRRALAHLTVAEAAAVLGITSTSLLMYSQRQTTGEKFLYSGQVAEGAKRHAAQQKAAADRAARQAEAARAARLRQVRPVIEVFVAGQRVALPAPPWGAGAQVQP